MNLVQALYLNNDVKPFNNEKVRQAMCYAVNVDEILDLTSEGHGTKIGTSIYPAFTKYFDAQPGRRLSPTMWTRPSSCWLTPGMPTGSP